MPAPPILNSTLFPKGVVGEGVREGVGKGQLQWEMEWKRIQEQSRGSLAFPERAEGHSLHQFVERESKIKASGTLSDFLSLPWIVILKSGSCGIAASTVFLTVAKLEVLEIS